MKPDKWYVLYTSPRAEKMVEKRLITDGVEAYLPLYNSKRKWSDRIKVVEMPLFTSYIFVHCNEYKVRMLSMYQGVVGAVYYLGKPAVVRDEEISAIKEFVLLANDNRVISEGDVVDIISGPFEYRSGKIIKFSEKFSYLYLEEMGAKVWIETVNIEKCTKK
jgi:transcription antitermination factor NusG